MLKQQLGLPTEEEQAALAALTGGGSGAGGAGDQAVAADSAVQAAEPGRMAQAEDQGHAAGADLLEGDGEVREEKAIAAAGASPAGTSHGEGRTPGSTATRRKRGER